MRQTTLLTQMQEGVKDELRRKKNKKGAKSSDADMDVEPAAEKPKKKRVSFG